MIRHQTGAARIAESNNGFFFNTRVARPLAVGCFFVLELFSHLFPPVTILT